MAWTEDELRAALVEWLRWHAPSRQERDRTPEKCRPLFDAMSKASGVGVIARLAKSIEDKR